MKETYFAYKIIRETDEFVCSHYEFEEDNMLAVLKDIHSEENKGIYWIFKQRDGKPQEALCLIDCEHKRIYYHYSGEVEQLEDVIQKLSQ